MRMPSGSVISVSCNDVYSFTKPVRDEIVLVTGIGVEGDVHAGVLVKHRSRVAADPTQPNLRQVHLMQGELFGEVGGKGYTVAPGDLGENVTTGGIDLLALPLGTVLRFGQPRGDAARPSSEERSAVTGRATGTALDAAVRAPAAGPGLDAAVQASGTGAGLDAAVQASGTGAGLDAAVRASAPATGLDAAVRAPSPGTALDAVLAVAAAAVLDGPTAAAAAAIAAAAARDTGDDLRPAVVIAGLRNPCAQINDFQHGLLKEVVGQDENGDLIRKAGIMAVVLRGGPIRAGDPVHAELPPHPYAPLERV